VLAVAKALSAARMVVVTSPGADKVARLASEWGAESAVQDRQLGTGHAVLSAEQALAGFDGDLLVLFGDAPLLTAGTLSKLTGRLGPDADIAALGFRATDPAGYGRMVAKGDSLQRIVEHKDASQSERKIDLCFAGMLAGKARTLFALLHAVTNDNAQGEFYLTDVIALAGKRGLHCAVVEGPEAEMQGVNSRAQLAEADAKFQARMRLALMDAGVTLISPETIHLSADTAIEPDVTVGPFVVFGPGVSVKRGAEIRAFCHIEGAEVGEGAIVGPFARLRPGAVLEESVHIGNFVEVKAARLEKGAKANHLAYVGDARVGAGTNIGAGTITCNYDGENKHNTDIGAGVFVGSNSTLVAPLTIADGAYVAAGSTITENIEKDALAIGRARQVAKPGMAEKIRARNKARKNRNG
jgi:bifunctional UDP-N-acetylglucosamine pyrophosphorylase/glucosamine-1-phosphate N-acetyltransferase